MGSKNKYVGSVMTRCTGRQEEVIVPEGITEIGEGAFEQNSYVRIVRLPKSLLYIRRYAFKDCQYLEKVIFPDGLLEIGDFAFQNCYRMKSLELPEGLQKIGNEAFARCNELVNVQIPDAVKSIGKAAFAHCENLAEIKLPADMETIPASFFFGAERLRKITFPKNLKTIETHAFAFVRKMKLRFPETLEKIEEHAFAFSRDLTIFFPKYFTAMDFSGMDYVGDFAVFAPSVPFRSGIPPYRIASVLGYAEAPADLLSVLSKEEEKEYIAYLRRYRLKFYPYMEKFENLVHIMIEHRIIPYEDIDGLLERFQEKATVTAALLNYKESLMTPKMIRKLERREAREFERMFTDEAPTVTEMKKEWRFEKLEDGTLLLRYYKGNASEVRVPARIGNMEVSAIGDFAFSQYRSHITDEQCERLHNIQSVTVPATVKSIGKNLFKSCAQLQTVEFLGGIKEFPAFTFFDCKQLTSVTLPEGLEKIGESAFYDCCCLTEMDIPDSVKVIEKSAFDSCCGLETVNISENVREIGERAFFLCINLKNITLSENVTRIGENAFQSCSVTARVKKGSYAETYLNENQIPFETDEAVEDAPAFT